MGYRRTNSTLDAPTEQARALLFYKHMDRVSDASCDPNRDGLAMDDETLHMELLLAPSLVDAKDWDYQVEVDRIDDLYTEKNRVMESGKRGWDIPPKAWRGEMRFMQRRACFIEACHNGMLSVRDLPVAMAADTGL